MIVDFEFLGIEPIENLITGMHFKLDRVIYFGYQDVIQRRRTSTENFLRKYCGVEDVSFMALSEKNLNSVMAVMRRVIEKELAAKNEIYVDVTGGEWLIILAFGMLANEYHLPLHMFDIGENTLIELLPNADGETISRRVQARNLRLSIDKYIEMKGGIVNHDLHKEMKSASDKEYVKNIQDMWQVIRKHNEVWNSFSAFMRNHLVPNSGLKVSGPAEVIKKELSAETGNLKTTDAFQAVLDDLADAGLILNLRHDSIYSFRFLNEEVKELIWDSGSTLELYTYLLERDAADDCNIGVHLDWDGEIHNDPTDDVLNEIDVLVMNGMIPTFISCKSGKMGTNQTLHALYELETVTRRFGGKYAKRVLIVAHPLNKAYMKRAAEMNIEVRVAE